MVKYRKLFSTGSCGETWSHTPWSVITHKRIRIVLLATAIVLLTVIVVVVVVAIEVEDKVDRLSCNNGANVVKLTLAITVLVLKPAWWEPRDDRFIPKLMGTMTMFFFSFYSFHTFNLFVIHPVPLVHSSFYSHLFLVLFIQSFLYAFIFLEPSQSTASFIRSLVYVFHSINQLSFILVVLWFWSVNWLTAY